MYVFRHMSRRRRARARAEHLRPTGIQLIAPPKVVCMFIYLFPTLHGLFFSDKQPSCRIIGVPDTKVVFIQSGKNPTGTGIENSGSHSTVEWVYPEIVKADGL